MKLSFYGGVGTVTGSKYLLETNEARVLVDCGLFQGFKQLRLRNWAEPPFDPAGPDAVVLTHAHIDHSGYLPVLIRKGFKGPVYSTRGTRDLCAILLPDSGYLHERDAEYANRHRTSKHKPALPLYTEAEGVAAISQFRATDYEEEVEVAPGIRVTFRQAGHILGASVVHVRGGGTDVLFSGDLGRPRSRTMCPPAKIERAGYLVLESTYGDRLHSAEEPLDALEKVVNRTVERGGVVLIPSFAVGRTQDVLYYLAELKSTGRIPDVPIFVDSPMATEATELFVTHHRDHRLSGEDCRRVFHPVTYTRDVEHSRQLDERVEPKIIISASGMATGGRVVHHLKKFLPDARNTVLFAGYQAGGTRGASLVGGAMEVKIHGEYIDVNAEIDNLDMLSAHADYAEILEWLEGFEEPPVETFITHGEPAAADALRHRLEEELGWSVCVPDYRDSVTLGAGGTS